MSRSLNTISEQLTQLESHTQDLYRQLCHSYLHYLQLLEQQLHRQLVLSVHHICTQLYPQEFLELSTQERQRLQKDTRQLGGQLPTRFFAQLQERGIQLEGAPLTELPAGDLPPEEADTKDSNFNIRAYFRTQEDEEIEDLASTAQEGAEALLSKITAMASSGELMEMLLGPPERPSRPQWDYPIGHPETLARWGSIIEQSLEQVLEDISGAANQILQRAHIIPHPLPAKVLEIALQSEENGTPAQGGKLPHILSLIIEMTQLAENTSGQGEEKDEEGESVRADQQSKILKVIAIRLKLNELEFQDTALVASRKQLRQLAEHLKKLHKHHQHLHREQHILAAENAWRASWHLGE